MRKKPQRPRKLKKLLEQSEKLLSEKFPINAIQRGRGRPRDPTLDRIAAHFEGIEKGLKKDPQRRHHNNRKHMLKAILILEKADPSIYSYFVDDDTGRLRQTALSHLGRIKSVQYMLITAKTIAEKKLDTSQAIALCRRAKDLEKSPNETGGNIGSNITDIPGDGTSRSVLG